MGMKFATYDDARRRLASTICKYEGKPYHVSWEQKGTFTLSKVEGAIFKSVEYTDEAFDYSFPEIGYVNYNGHAYYVERSTKRDQRMGLPPDMLTYEHGRVPNDLFRSKGMENMLLNIYPTVKEACNSIKNVGMTSVAISRDYALGRTETGAIEVLYHGNPIATYSDGRLRYNPHVKKISFFIRHFGALFEDDLRKVQNV